MLACVSAILAGLLSCSEADLKPVKVELGTRSISKLPFVIALDQGLYEKYGLAIDIRLPPPAFDGGIHWQPDLLTRIARRIERARGRDAWVPDIYIDGHTPNIVKRIDRARWPHRIAIAGTDCLVRTHVIGAKQIKRLDELKGKRLGISSRRDTTLGFAALSLAKRMGWDATQDISIKLEGRDVGALREGLVDAIVANEIRGAQAMQEGFPVLEDMQKWNIAVAGNSVMVEKGWLDSEANRDTALRFLRATVEGLALFHNDRELALDVMARWNGITDSDIATHAYQRGQWMLRKPYPCYDGIKNTFAMYDSNEMRKWQPTDFYDDSLIGELDQNGFIDSFYDK